MDSLPFCKATIHGIRCAQGPYFTQIKRYPANPKTIGEMLRKRRLDLCLRQIDVARIIGCNEMRIVNWETGRRKPHVRIMSKIIQFLGFNPLPTGSTIGEHLVAHRKSRGLTQKEAMQTSTHRRNSSPKPDLCRSYQVCACTTLPPSSSIPALSHFAISPRNAPSSIRSASILSIHSCEMLSKKTRMSASTTHPILPLCSRADNVQLASRGPRFGRYPQLHSRKSCS